MRSWDGKLTTDSAAASLVTQARYAFWPLILKPKLGEEAGEYVGGEELCRGRDHHARQCRLASARLQELGRLADRCRAQGHGGGQCSRRRGAWSYGSWHVVDVEHPLARFLPLVGRVAGTGEQPQSGDTTTVKQVGRAFGPSQRFTMDWSNVDGSTENIVLGESGNPYSPVLPRPMEGLVRRHDLCAALQPGSRGRADTPHAAAAAMKRQGTGIREQGRGLPGAPGLAFEIWEALEPLRRPRRHPAGGGRGHCAATAARQLLRARLRLPSGLLVRRA
jgi:hypothetical protein